jgi:TonB family protein
MKTGLIALVITLVVIIPALNRCRADESIVKPVLIERPKIPEIPPSVKQSSAKGMALIKASVGDTGDVTDAEMIRPTGLSYLDTFLLDWVATWKYLPRSDEKTASVGFTVIMIRYDLLNQTFNAPMPIDAPMQVPNASLNQPDKEQKETSLNARAKTDPPLKIGAIPLEIQKLQLKGKLKLQLTTDEEGMVIQVVPDTENLPEKFGNWLINSLTGTKWILSGNEEVLVNRKIMLPVIYDTQICKIQFDPAEVMETVKRKNVAPEGAQE